jgi:ribosomal protein L11 methyltransferase
MVPRQYPALRIEWSDAPGPERIDQLLAVLDDECPTAVDEHARGLSVFFSEPAGRDRAVELARTFAPEAVVTAVSMSDGSWAERSQASLTAIRVGRIVVTPPWRREDIATSSDGDIVITIVPSMGFGTGHHASTRLCLHLLQSWRDGTRSVLDVGTGSGVLAIAAWRLGAARVVGIDVDADALTSARENADLNGAGESVTLQLADLASTAPELLGRFDLVLANLTGAMLGRSAPALASLVAPGGTLIVSGFQRDEESSVQRAVETSQLRAVTRANEDDWVAIVFGSARTPGGA